MKSEDSLSKSASARLKDAIGLATNIAVNLEDIEREARQLQSAMPVIREELSELAQAIHEFNAYRNALDTE